MTTKRSKCATRLSWCVRATLLLFGLRCIDDDGGIREDEFACEEAAAHVDGCCPQVDTKSIDCDYWTGCGSTHPTLLTIEESRCITDLDCDTLVESGICDELQRAIPNQNSEAEPTSQVLELGPCSG